MTSARSPTAICAAGALLRYAGRTQAQGLSHIQTLSADRASQYVLMDPATRRNLELTRTLSGEEAPTLFSILDSCRTPMGARLLRRWLHHPLRDNAPVLARQQAIAALMQANDTQTELLHATPVLESLRKALNALPDLERIATRIALLSVRPRELASLRDALGALPQLQVLIASAQSSQAPEYTVHTRLQELASHLLPPAGMELAISTSISAVAAQPPSMTASVAMAMIFFIAFSPGY